MIKRMAVVVFLLTFAASAAAQIRGAWTAEVNESDPSKFHLQISRRNNNSGRTMRVSSFAGLSAAQMRSTTQVPANFALRSEAGAIDFEGTFKEGYGAGQFTFTPNPSFLDNVRSLGVSVEPGGKHRGRERNLDERLLHYTINDVTTAFIRSMQAEGYNVSLDEYLSFRIFRVDPQLVRDLASLGYRNIDADDLVSSQIHRVTPQYIRDMNAAGFRDLALHDLVSTRIHRVTPEFAREMSELGYSNLDRGDLTSFRIHRVTPEFIRELRELGYDNIPASKLVSMRIHRVTPEFIREMKAAGYSNIPVDKLISMKIHGVDAVFTRKMNGM
ncbi:MAG TPA: hypothetical protein VFT12_01800 [Thermoanaerobaculia bacterium]|nr:hypothetical protein [Thermoanaerobaculia bacterium]